MATPWSKNDDAPVLGAPHTRSIEMFFQCDFQTMLVSSIKKYGANFINLINVQASADFAATP
jgi:hypothetical protein